MSDFSISITIHKPAAEALRAITDVRGWWFGEITGSSDKLGDEFTYHVPGVHRSKQRVIELGNRIVWKVIESDLTFSSAPHEWTGTTLEFEVRSSTIVFTHRGLVPKFVCYGTCSSAWTTLIEKNLRGWIETGVVQPSPW